MFRLLLLIFALFASSVYAQDVIMTDSTSNSTVTSDTTSTIKTPPPSAIAPSINSANSDLCTVGVSGAVQTQILGISAGKTVRDMNCERLKNAKTMYDMGMKVAAVSVMCEDRRVFEAMMNAGTPCPYDGKIGEEAKAGWAMNPEAAPGFKAPKEKGKKLFGNMKDEDKSTAAGAGSVLLLLLLLL